MDHRGGGQGKDVAKSALDAPTVRRRRRSDEEEDEGEDPAAVVAQDNFQSSGGGGSGFELSRQPSMPGAYRVYRRDLSSGGGAPIEDDDDGRDQTSLSATETRPDVDFVAEATLVEEDDGRDDSDSNDCADEEQPAPSDGAHVALDLFHSHESLSSSAGDETDGVGNPSAISQDSVHSVNAGDDRETIVTAEPMKNKCVLSRRTMLIAAAIVLIVVLGTAIPLASRNHNAPPPPPPSDDIFPDDDEVVTFAPRPICFSLLPLMTNVSKVCPDPANLPKGGPLCQLIADGLLDASNANDPRANVDVALINGGAMRGDVMAGDLTAGTVRDVIMPFVANRVVHLLATPAEIKSSLEGSLFDSGQVVTEEMQKKFFPEAPTVPLHWSFESAYPYAAGLRYDVNLTAPQGAKVFNVRINRGYSDSSGWMPLDVTDTASLIRVVTSDYLAGGGDGYFPDVPEERKEVMEGLGVTDLFLQYCSRREELVGPDYVDGMSTREFVPLGEGL